MSSGLRQSLPTLLLGVLLAISVPLAADVSGTYVEARTADIYTGPCFANGEVNLVGEEAILAWQIERGVVDGIDVAGLGMVLAVVADGTLGDLNSELPATRAVLLVDERANGMQRQALATLVEKLARRLTRELVAVEAAPIRIGVDLEGHSFLRAGETVRLGTRSLGPDDHLCGNESVYYPPLTAVLGARPAVTLEHEYSGPELGVVWKSPGKRSAFVATFRYRDE